MYKKEETYEIVLFLIDIQKAVVFLSSLIVVNLFQVACAGEGRVGEDFLLIRFLEFFLLVLCELKDAS